MNEGTERAVVAGPDEGGIGAALETLGVDVTYLDGPATRDSLLEAGLDGADLLVLTDMGDASVVPVARDEAPGVRVVAYAPDTLPEFVRGQVDLAVDPALLDADVVAEELI